MIVREVRTNLEMRGYIETLSEFVIVSDLMEVDDLSKSVRNKIKAGRDKQTQKRNVYLADLSELLESKCKKYNSIDELRTSIISDFDSQFVNLNKPLDIFDYITVDGDLFVYGVNESPEDEKVFGFRMRKLDEIENAISAIETFVKQDMYEIELMALKQKYNKS